MAILGLLVPIALSSFIAWIRTGNETYMACTAVVLLMCISKL